MHVFVKPNPSRLRERLKLSIGPAFVPLVAAAPLSAVGFQSMIDAVCLSAWTAVFAAHHLEIVRLPLSRIKMVCVFVAGG